ncbi:MAG TPA: ATP-binding protein, partial [Pirellulaceae bacterium]|nr:ATP-binding protein [Pirellulaceae bacterium]
MGTGEWIGLCVVVLLVGLVLGGFIGGSIAAFKAFGRRIADGESGQEEEREVKPLLVQHFAPVTLERLVVAKRRFPMGIRADLQHALDDILGTELREMALVGVKAPYAHLGIEFANLLTRGSMGAFVAPPEYEEVDIGDNQAVRCHNSTLWLVETQGKRAALLLSKVHDYHGYGGLEVSLAMEQGDAQIRISEELFRRLEAAVKAARSYRGKILSLEREASYSGRSAGIKVHKLHTVDRDQVILPPATLELLDRNVLRFVAQRERLRQFGQPTKKGLLFYGPPGTGKTHTIHYLAAALKDHTTLLIAAEQVGFLGEYMSLARLYQPSLVILEDVDLIARDRESMDSPCAEALLNKLLNEMDGLREDADILFVLTTNRPEQLELALASRPGRVDQAIEFPLPNEEGRRKLIHLYSRGMRISEEIVANIVRRTSRVSAAFIKELMRRSMQFQLER